MSRSTAQIMMVKTKGACHPSPEYRAPPMGGAYGILHQSRRSHCQQYPASSIQHPASSIQHHSIQAVMCREEGLRFTYNGRTDGDARGGETNLPADILLGYVLAYQRESNCTVNISLRSLLITTAHRGRSCEARPRVGGRGTRGGGVHDGGGRVRVSLRTGPNNRAGCALNEPRDDHHGIRLYEHEEDQAQFEG
jgi:hypothetical protein